MMGEGRSRCLAERQEEGETMALVHRSRHGVGTMIRLVGEHLWTSSATPPRTVQLPRMIQLLESEGACHLESKSR
jgi:hypothetical protein